MSDTVYVRQPRPTLVLALQEHSPQRDRAQLLLLLPDGTEVPVASLTNAELAFLKKEADHRGGMAEAIGVFFETGLMVAIRHPQLVEQEGT